MGILVSIWKGLLCLTLTLGLIAFSPGIPPFGVEFKPYEVERIYLSGKLAPDSRLDAAEFLPTEVIGSQYGIIEV